MKIDRKSLDEAIASMFSNPDYTEYVFYAHILGQCKIAFDSSMPAPAGVSFNINHYTLWINIEEFSKWSLAQRLGILKHEMKHILNNHVKRAEERVQLPWNIATDTAINQDIKRAHLPEGCCYPDVFGFPEKLSSEEYYELLKQEAEKNQCDSCQGSGHSDEDCEHCQGSGQNEDGTECEHCKGTGKETCPDCQGSGSKHTMPGDHGKWQESEGDEDLKKDITKGMIEKSISKSRGNVPNDIADMLALFTRPSQVSWKKVLKNITSNKKANSRRTIMRQDRRFPNREDLKGKTKDRTFDLAVIVDVSGSMSDKEIMIGLNEIHAICKMTNTSLKMVQVDTQPRDVEEFSKKTKLFKRKASGGTYLYPAIEKLREQRVQFDALVFITDGGIEDVSRWEKPPHGRVIFLTTDCKIPGIENTRYQSFELSKA